jgi:hypothetical protein
MSGDEFYDDEATSGRAPDDLADYGQHGEPCWYAGHVPGCGCRAGGDVELLPGWISYEQDGQTIEVEVTGA